MHPVQDFHHVAGPRLGRRRPSLAVLATGTARHAAHDGGKLATGDVQQNAEPIRGDQAAIAGAVSSRLVSDIFALRVASIPGNMLGWLTTNPGACRAC
jgi:hypothetical protein